MVSKLLAGRSILVVEDEMMILLMLEEIILAHGCESVKLASTVAQALALIDANILDAAILDINLNGIESFPVADALAARDVPFLFVTGYSAGYLKGRYSKRPVLRKPFRVPDLVAALKQLLSD